MKTLTELLAEAHLAVDALANVPAVEIVSESVVPNVQVGALNQSNAPWNTVQIRKTLSQKGRCDLPPGLVQIDNDIRVASGNQIRGLGNPDNPSIIQVVPGSPAVAARGPAGAWYSIFQSNTAAGALVGDTFGLPVGPAHEVTIQNLVLDCGFDEQTRVAGSQSASPTTCQAISIEGLGLVVEDVETRNHAKGKGGGECFPIRMWAPQVKCTEVRTARLSRIRCSHIGSAGSTHTGAGGDEITLFSLVGSPANLLVAPVIEDCVVTGLKRGPSQPSPIHVFHTTYSIGDTVRNNTVLDSDATCVYRDTGRSRFSRVTGNIFSNVHRGVSFNAVSDFDAREFDISDNVIFLLNGQPIWNVNATPAGILFQRMGLSGVGFVGGTFSGNRIAAPYGPFGTQQFYGRGIYLELRSKTDAAALVARDNLIDVLQPSVGTYYPPGWKSLLAIYIANQAAWDPTTPCLRAWGNRDSSGLMLPVTVVDSGYIPRLSVPQQ